MLHVPPRRTAEKLSLPLREAACVLATALYLGGYQPVQPSTCEHREHERHADADEHVAEQDEYATDEALMGDARHKAGVAGGCEDGVGCS